MPTVQQTVEPTTTTDTGANGKEKQKKPTKPLKTAKVERKVIYPNLEVNGIKLDPSKLKISCDVMKKILGWETESEWAERLKRADKSLAGIDLKFEMHEPPLEPLLTDDNKERVICKRNYGNRPFDEKTARSYAQDMLTGKWRLNGETIIVGETGQVESGQHRGVGFILACQRWASNKAMYAKIWPEEPTLNTLVVFGISEAPDTVRTLDNVKTRQLSDTIYTSPTFADLTSNTDKRECSRMLDAAIDLLWKRTGASETAVKYQTHAASFDFFDRHKRLEKCVREVFELNKSDSDTGRAISLLRLSPGQSAACLYLMGASATDVDVYRNANPVPSEKKIDWEHWDRALQFWKQLVSDKDKAARPVRLALKDLADEGKATAADKIMVLCKAWNLFVKHQPIKQDDLELSHKTKDTGTRELLDDDVFGGTKKDSGIDLGMSPEPVEEEVEEKQVEQTKEEIAEEKRKLAEAQVTKAEEKLINPSVNHEEQKKKLLANRAANGGVGKAPPATLTRKQVEAEQTHKAREVDAAKAK